MWMIALLTGCGLAGPGPADAAETYLRAAAKKNPDVSGHIDPACKDHKIARGGPMQVLGTPIDHSTLDVSLQEQQGDRAVVQYHVVGSVQASQTQTKTKLLGKEVEISIGGLDIGQLDLSGTLTMRRMGGKWKVSCPQ